jgi:hypothetical protein
VLNQAEELDSWNFVREAGEGAWWLLRPLNQHRKRKSLAFVQRPMREIAQRLPCIFHPR